MSAGNDPAASASPPATDYVVLAAGIMLLLIPLAFIAFVPDSQNSASFFLRVIAALGGALAGASLPGILHVELPFARAGGALAILLLIYSTNPPQAAQRRLEAIAQEAAVDEQPAREAHQNPSDDRIPAVAAAGPPTTRPVVGWIYVGTFRGTRWIEPGLAIPGTLPVTGAEYPVRTTLNVRKSPPRFPLFGLADIVGTAREGQVAEILGHKRLGRDRVWARVRVE